MNKLFLFLALTCLMVGQAQALSVMAPPDMSYTALHKAAEDCDVEKERNELKALQPADRNTEINRLDREGYTPLSYAARYGCIKVVKLLVKSGALVDVHEDRGGWTPLLYAADQRHADVVSYLLANGADVNHRTPFGWTSLTAAIQGGVFQRGPAGSLAQTIDALLSKNADVNLPGISGWTPLITAVFQEDTALVRLLISKGANLSAKDEKGKTALDYAKERDLQEIVVVLKKP